MTLGESLSIAGGFLSIFGAIIAIFVKLFHIAEQQGENMLKLNTLWEAFKQMALAESVNKGFLKMNSPVRSTAKSIEVFENIDLRHKLRDFYKAEGYRMDDVQLQFEILKRFGDQLLKEIAIPYNLHSGGHIIAAIKIAKGEDLIDEPVH